jgi:hypothetical protein
LTNEIFELLKRRSDADVKGNIEATNALEAELIALAESCEWDETALTFVREFGQVYTECPEIVPSDWAAFAELAAWMERGSDMATYSAINAVPHDGDMVPAGPVDLVSISSSFDEADRARVLGWWTSLSDLQRQLVDTALLERWHINISFD